MPSDAGPLIRSLVSLRQDHRTGVLEVTAEGVRTSIYLMEGNVIFAEEEPSLETLGRLLVGQGTITAEQYTRTIESMTEALAEDEQLRFGEIAVDHGLIDGDQLNDALGEQARRRLVRVIRRTDHEWRLDDRAERVAGVPLYHLEIEAAVLEALRSSPDEDLNIDQVPAALAPRLGSFPVLSAEPSAIAARFGLGPRERAYVAMIDGSKTIAECMQMGAALVDRPAILLALFLTRAIKLVERRPGADEEPPSAPSPVAAVPVRVDAAPAVPVRVDAAPAVPVRVDAAPAVPVRVDAAPPAPIPAVAPSPTAPVTVAKATHAARLNAELALQKGKTLVREAKIGPAIEELRRAHALNPTPEIELYLRWLEVELTKRVLRDPERLLLLRLALTVTRQDADNAFGAYVVGRIAGIEGRKNDAHRWMERAFRLDSRLRWLDAQREP